jgi:hypothetical protein
MEAHTTHAKDKSSRKKNYATQKTMTVMGKSTKNTPTKAKPAKQDKAPANNRESKSVNPMDWDFDVMPSPEKAARRYAMAKTTTATVPSTNHSPRPVIQDHPEHAAKAFAKMARKPATLVSGEPAQETPSQPPKSAMAKTTTVTGPSIKHSREPVTPEMPAQKESEPAKTVYKPAPMGAGVPLAQARSFQRPKRAPTTLMTIATAVSMIAACRYSPSAVASIRTMGALTANPSQAGTPQQGPLLSPRTSNFQQDSSSMSKAANPSFSTSLATFKSMPLFASQAKPVRTPTVRPPARPKAVSLVEEAVTSAGWVATVQQVAVANPQEETAKDPAQGKAAQVAVSLLVPEEAQDTESPAPQETQAPAVLVAQPQAQQPQPWEGLVAAVEAAALPILVA